MLYPMKRAISSLSAGVFTPVLTGEYPSLQRSVLSSFVEKLSFVALYCLVVACFTTLLFLDITHTPLFTEGCGQGVTAECLQQAAVLL